MYRDVKHCDANTGLYKSSLRSYIPNIGPTIVIDRVQLVIYQQDGRSYVALARKELLFWHDL